MPPLQPKAASAGRNQLPYLPLPRLEAARAWRTIEFTGAPLTDFLNLQLGEGYLRNLVADTAHAGGVRLRFGPHVSYACFFEVLVRVWAVGPQTFWLDVRRHPATVYCVTLPPNGRARTSLPVVPARL